MIHGTYAYRFTGFAVDMATPSYVIGLGQMSIDRDGAITGFHRSSGTQLTGGGSAIEVAEFSLKGQLEPAPNGEGPWDLHADIQFHMIPKEKRGPIPSHQNLWGSFRFIPAGGPDD